MLATKCALPFLVLVLVNVTLSKPTDENYVTEGRGIGSTLWDWITYPFSWWSSEETDKPVHDHLVATSTSTIGPFDNIEVGRHNVTVWCNDHTCTTMKCDKHGCRNNTCNIYDTNLTGECREFHTDVDPEEPQTTSESPKPIEDNKITEDVEINTSSNKTPNATVAPPADTENNHNEPETPLELEAVLSSTVTENETSAVHSKDTYSSKPIQV